MDKKITIFFLICVLSLSSARLLYADTAEVLPKGIFLGEIKTDFYFKVDERFDSDGNTEDLAFDYNTSLNSNVFGALAAVENGFQLPAGFASLGDSEVSFELDFTLLEVNFFYGLTEKVTLGLKIPYWWVENDVDANVDSTNATVGFNPMHGQAGDPFGGQAPIIPIAYGGVPLTTEDVQTMLGQGLPGMPKYGYDRIEDFDDDGISDIEAGARYQYFNNEKWRLAFVGAVRFPTGESDNPHNLQDYPFGKGATALLFHLNNDFFPTKNLLLNATFKYDLYLSDNEEMRVPEDVNFPITLESNTESVDRNVGNIFETSLYSHYTIGAGFGCSLEYMYATKKKDDIDGDKGLSYESLEDESDFMEQVYKVGLTYSTMDKYLDKTFPVPIVASVIYRNRFKGENLLKSEYVRFALQVYF